jgi:peptidoglycan/xylan/chitin deacetylase (PgdA/CDA1 family)
MKVIVLNYHRVFPGHHMSTETFEWQIRKLKKRFKPLTLKEAVEFAKGNLKLEKDGFVITFDDGWADNFIYAYPILKKHGVPATIFAPTAFINKKLKEPRKSFRNNYDDAMNEVAQNGYSYEFLTWEEIRQMSPLVKIESHGHRHIHFAESSPEESEKDLKTSMKIILEETGQNSNYFAWPFGEYDKKSIETAKKSGLEACFTTKIGSIKKDDNLYELKRFSPPRRDWAFKIASKNFAGMAAYKTGVKLFQILHF